MGKPKVLIVEDQKYLVEFWRELLGDEVEVIWAKTLEEGKRLFKETPELELVVMDCCVPGNKPNSSWLVKEIRESGFTKPIIAKSSMTEYCQTLLAVGASHSASPDEVPSLVLKLLEQAGED